MEINVLEETKKSIKIELVGEDHTLSNALRQELWNDSEIIISGYNIDHPLIDSPILVVETSGKKEARKTLFDAVDRLKKKNEELLSKLKKL